MTFIRTPFDIVKQEIQVKFLPSDKKGLWATAVFDIKL
jgi:hypothetical protein